MNFLRTAVNVTAVNEKFCQKAMWRPSDLHWLTEPPVLINL